MRVPFITKRSGDDDKRLYRRKGGGGGGRGGGGGGGGRSGGGGGGRTGGGSSTPVSAAGSTRGATPYGNGGGPQVTIAQGLPFAGRLAGGGTRSQVFGNRQFGSGYPGVAGRSVAGRGFPFFFWPIAWGGLLGGGTAAYLHNSEYGRPDNSSRPGGPIVTAAFISNSTNTTFRVISDNSTVTELITDVKSNCSSYLSDSSTTFPDSYNDSLSSVPQPEQTVQYYRASSVALTLDGYNNTAALGPDDGTPDAPLPNNIDTTLLDCLNQTIGQAVPLIGAASHTWATPNVELVGTFGLLWWFLALIL